MVPAFLILTILFRLLLILLLLKWFMNRSGWAPLVRRFRTDGKPSCEVLRRQSISVGSLICRGTASVGFAPDGLFLSLGWFPNLSPRPVFIPWAQLAEVGPPGLWEVDVAKSKRVSVRLLSPLAVSRLRRFWLSNGPAVNCAG